ncbi:hypothetical protein [Rhizobium oryzicola]|uniref:Uncharacterized protein n=1 Tax=Rhizobium oryzicola TaxID=1232668 RepID=A0ABT8T2T6_9HYPH|nr:hypothetical protein [Rhizobium oryzicola]MDO1584953.1 hypothetical protein [Rhizobium oryzicola]
MDEQQKSTYVRIARNLIESRREAVQLKDGLLCYLLEMVLEELMGRTPITEWDLLEPGAISKSDYPVISLAGREQFTGTAAG